ncbi:M15 family metallopeptidase [Microbacterium paludicola]|uniref:M15 family metallopeptidase n=1 Tax=Microbacterium paludicola TaxID=300019 RepID=UPI0011A46ED3|nr:M15 family metallopeptidase [Microbacterium paludicola]
MRGALHPRHASRPPRSLHVALPVGLVVTALGALWALSDAPSAAESAPLPPAPSVVAHLPGVDVSAVAPADPCADAAVRDALASGDDEAAVTAFGGGMAFRDAVVTGNAPCVSLSDPNRHWVVVNKSRALEPADHEPAGMTEASVQMTTASHLIDEDAASALAEMAAALRDAGAGELGMNNAYRSYGLQVSNYSDQVAQSGQSVVDLSSARPGFSEHQTGFAVDVVACGSGCGEIGAFGGTSESDWVAAHSWEYGFIIRYEPGQTGTTGYEPEPWHLRYVGPALAAAYHEGGFRSLEEFFGLPAAPDYPH